MKLNMKKERYQSVLKNKNFFNTMLKDHINNSSTGIQAIKDVGDADYLVAQTAIMKSKDNEVVVISADTDVLILLIHGTDISGCKIYLTSDSVTSGRSAPKVWDIHDIIVNLGDDVCRNILIIHSFFGCDTVSRIYGFGKGTGLKKFINNEQFRSSLSSFSNEGVSQCDIASARRKGSCYAIWRQHFNYFG